MYLKATIVSLLIDIGIYGYIYLSIYTFFNPSYISIMFLLFTEVPINILNHDVCILLSVFCTKS